MKTIYIGFSRPKGQFKIFSNAIRWIEKRDFSHTYVLIDDMVYHAAKGMVHSVSFENFSRDNETIISHEIELTEEQFKSGFNFIKNTLGISYGFDQILGIFIQKIFRKREPIIQNNSQRMICSEFSAKFLISSEIDIDILPDAITPSDLQNFLEVNYGKN